MVEDTLATRLKRLRLQADLTQKQLADRTRLYKPPKGLDRSMIGKIETGLRPNPSLETLQVLAQALGCLIDDLVPRGELPLNIREESEAHETAHNVLLRRIIAKAKGIENMEDLQRILDYIEFIEFTQGRSSQQVGRC